MAHYYLTVNGTPACQSDLTIGFDPPVVCAQGSVGEALETARRILDRHPAAGVGIHPGRAHEHGATESGYDERGDYAICPETYGCAEGRYLKNVEYEAEEAAIAALRAAEKLP